MTGRLYADDTIFDRLRGVADSGYATSPYIGPLSGLAFDSGYCEFDRARASPPTPPRWRPRSWPARCDATGVTLRPRPRSAKAPAGAETVAEVRSPTIARLATATDVYSNNFYAETLVKLLGAHFGAAGTTGAGAAVVER